jgi:site-specific DNA-methyltransferase (adenine-specific)
MTVQSAMPGQTRSPSTMKLYGEDCLVGIPSRVDDESVSVIVTSPPYNIGKPYKLYKDDVGSEEYLDWIGQVSGACQDALEPDGSFFLNLGSKPSDPWWPMRVAGKIRDSGWVLQNTILWVKSIAISKEEVGDYPGISGDVAVGHFKPVNSRRYVNSLSEYIFHFTKRGDVELDKLGVGVPYQDKTNVERWKSGGGDLRDRGSVWFIPYETIRASRPHPCVFPVKLPEMCVRLHGLSRTHLVLDPFLGTGSTALAADRLNVRFVGFEIDPYYLDLARCNIERQRETRSGSARDRPARQEPDPDRLSKGVPVGGIELGKGHSAVGATPNDVWRQEPGEALTESHPRRDARRTPEYVECRAA